MKKTLIVIFLFFAANLYAQSNESGDSTGSLKLTVIGIWEFEGTIRAALCNSEENYTSNDDPFGAAIIDVSDSTAEYIFEEIPFGTYAIKLIHDVDDNGTLNTNFLGIPQEPYGFSNNARGTFGPADWKDAKFEFTNDGQEVRIKVE